MLNRVVGEVIKEVRTQRKITQEKLAEHAELHTVHISRIERGESGVSLEAFFMICQGLQIAPSDMIRLIEKRLLEKMS